MKVRLVYDGSFDGFLTAVFTVYEQKLDVVSITPQIKFQAGFFAENIEIITDETKANRVWKGLEYFSNLRHNLYWSFLSEIDNHEIVMLRALQYVLKTSNEKDYGHPDILSCAQVTKMVGREKHRMEAFIRFQLTKDAIYFAKIAPDFNVLPLILKHFKNRYADQKWIIYDINRDFGLYYDLEKVDTIKMYFDDNKQNKSVFNVDEETYDLLWRDYFKSTNIKSRINMKLHIRHVPKRYWKYLNEKSIM
ncbi:MAG: TIGR03915 family putative DNA repair protein [Leeuwenhoekiella sp.]